MKLKETREAQGLTQRAFARQIGSPVPDYNKIERGRFLPTPELMGRICRALGKKPLELYERGEIDLLGALKTAPGRRGGDRHKYHARKVYRVPEEFAKPFPADFWPTLGYASEREAYLDWRRALEREYWQRKSPVGVATTGEAQEKNNLTLIVATKGGKVNGD